MKGHCLKIQLLNTLFVMLNVPDVPNPTKAKLGKITKCDKLAKLKLGRWLN